MASRVAFIGLGSMGKPMALNLCRVGFDVTAVARRPEVLEEFARLGARATRSPREAASSAQFVISIVRDEQETEQVLQGEDGALSGMPPGSIVLVCSTLNPAFVPDLASKASRQDVRVLDAPVTGSVLRARTGELTFIVGGDSDTLDQSRPVLLAMGKSIFHMGGIGAGMQAKLINNMLAGIHVMAACEAMRLGARAGLNTDQLLEMLKTGSGQSFELDKFNRFAETFCAGKYYRPVGGHRIMAKDLGLATKFASEQGEAAPVLNLAARLYSELDFSPTSNPFDLNAFRPKTQPNGT